MPPPLWKKAKIGKIASIVADLRSKRRRSSLVVETGFPTSLADLIVKNSSRLKKTSVKNVGSDPSSSPAPSVFQSQILDSPPPDDGHRSETGEVSSTSASSVSGGSRRDVKNVGVTGPACFTAIVKVFIVVVLALGTKELAIAITASAFALFFLEFVGKRWLFYSKPSAGSLELDVGARVCGRGDEIRRKSVSDSFKRRRDLELPSLDPKRMPSRVPSGEDPLSVKSIRNQEVRPSNEIQAIESDMDLRGSRRRLAAPVLEGKTAVSASVDDQGPREVEGARIQKTCSKNFKEKFLKKFVPKKFRHSKRGKHGSMESYDICDSIGEEEGEQDYEDEEICSSESSNDVLDDDMDDDDDDDVGDENMCRMIQWNAGHLFLLVVVLFGLIGGRTVAVVVTLTSCLLMRSVEAGWENLKMHCSGNLSCS